MESQIIRELQEKIKLLEVSYSSLMDKIMLLQEERGILMQEKANMADRIRALEKVELSMQTANNFLHQAISNLEKENKQFQKEQGKLIQENNQLKERLGLNSTNSSFPPSRDINRAKNKHKAKSDRKPGGQPGHQGHSYQPLPADEVIEVYPKICCCGGQLEALSKYTSHQKIEIPPIKPHVKEYRLFHGICLCCLKKQVAPLPEGVGKDLLGEHAKAIIASLNGFFHNSKREVQRILQDIFNLPISLGLVSATAKRVNDQLSSYYSKLEEQIRSSPFVHIDETGHRSQGKRGWAWIFTHKQASLLKLSNSRGKQVLAEVLAGYTGKVISDRYPVYNYFQQEKRQICWSHLVRDFERFAHSLDASLSSKGKRLVELGKEVFCIDKALKGGKIGENYFLRRVSKIKKEIGYIFKEILKIRGRPQAHRVVKRLIKSFEMMWRFVKDKRIEMTNNLAERQIHKYVLYRKKLLFTWSEWGNEFVERITSLFLTARLNKASAFEQLVQCIPATT